MKIFDSKEANEIQAQYRKLARDITDNYDDYSIMHKAMVNKLLTRLQRVNSELEQYDNKVKSEKPKDEPEVVPSEEEQENFLKALIDKIFGKNK
jgi:septation ring formation regulator EzrA